MKIFNSSRRVLVASMAALLLGAPDPTAAQGSSAGASAPKHGGSIAIAVAGTDLASLNTHISNTVGPLLLDDLWNDGLFGRDGEGRRTNRLAEGIKISDDGKTYTVLLRKGVKWSDGEAFTALDVAFNVELAKKYNRSWTTAGPLVESVATPDAHTVVLRLKEPFSPLLGLLGKNTFPLLPKHIYSVGDPATNPANRKPTGLGPFVLASWDQGQRITFERNPNFWDSPKPYLDGVVVSLIPNEQQQINALLNQEVQWAQLSNSQVKRVETQGGASGVKVWKPKFGTVASMLIDFNTASGPVADKKVRTALFRAIDRERIVKDAYNGHATVMKSAISPSFGELYSPAVDYTKSHPYDPVAAGKLLDEAGYPLKDGTRFNLTLTFPTSFPIYPFDATARIVAAQWEKIGVKVTLAGFDMGVYVDRVYTKRDFEASLIALSASVDPVLGVDRSFVCNARRVAFVNPTGFCDERFDTLAKKASRVPAAERQAVYKLYEELINDALPQIGLAEGVTSIGVSTKLHGLDAQLNISYDVHPNWAEVWVK